jgi:GTP-binding protein EngB required for normal cell division
MSSRKKGVIMLGETGVGKSNLGNFLLNKNLFDVSDLLKSQTQFVSKGESNDIFALDTPGVNDTSMNENLDEEHLTDIVKSFKKEKDLNSILILLNYQNTRLARNLKIMIKLFCAIFHISFFIEHLAIIFTRCFDEDGRPNDEELNKKKKQYDNEIKAIIKSTIINEEWNESNTIQYFFVNLNPKKKTLDEKTKEEMLRLKLWIISNDYMNTDIVQIEKHPGYKEEDEVEEFQEKRIVGEKLVIKTFKKSRKKLIYVDGSVKYEGDWKITLINEKEEIIPKFQELNSSIQQFQKDNEELINQLKEAKENNSLELEKLRLEYNTRVEEARARAQMMRENDNRNAMGNILGLILGGLVYGISEANRD